MPRVARVLQPADKFSRTCIKCNEQKPVGEFYVAKPDSPHGRSYGCTMPCKACNALRSKGRAESMRRLRLDPAQRELERERRRTPEAKAKARETYLAKRDRNDAIRKACRARHLARFPDYDAKRRLDPTKRPGIKEREKAYRSSPQGKAIRHACNSTRKAVIRGASGRVTAEAWRAILDVFDHRCAYCLKAGVKLTQDHVVAVVRGGQHTADNIVPACAPCNSRKRDRPIFLMARFIASPPP